MWLFVAMKKIFFYGTYKTLDAWTTHAQVIWIIRMTSRENRLKRMNDIPFIIRAFRGIIRVRY